MVKEEQVMKITRVRLFVAGIVAFMMGIPFTERVFAGGSDVVGSAIDLGLAIADSAQGS